MTYVACFSAAETVGAFGFQWADLNISLTAIGLLWNMADFLHRDRSALSKSWGEPLPIQGCPAHTPAEWNDRIQNAAKSGICRAACMWSPRVFSL